MISGGKIIMLKKLVLFSTLVSALSFSLFSQESQSAKLNSINAVFAWDFHDVLVEKDWPQLGKNISSLIYKDPTLLGLVVSPWFWAEVRATKEQCNITEEFIEQLAKKYPRLEKHLDDLISLINFHQPNEKSVAILARLKEQGYRHYFASNIGPKSLAIMKNRYPKIFNNFDGEYIPQTRNKNTGLLVAKPCVNYFNELRNYINQKEKGNPTILFVDDRINNIQGARESNVNVQNKIIGIHFQSAKQLENDVSKLVAFE